MIEFAKRLQSENGGFGGALGIEPHLASTYAMINALVVIGGEETLACIDR
jgi:protein farnesyltransferase subunit beta